MTVMVRRTMGALALAMAVAACGGGGDGGGGALGGGSSGSSGGGRCDPEVVIGTGGAPDAPTTRLSLDGPDEVDLSTDELDAADAYTEHRYLDPGGQLMSPDGCYAVIRRIDPGPGLEDTLYLLAHTESGEVWSFPVEPDVVRFSTDSTRVAWITEITAHSVSDAITVASTSDGAMVDLTSAVPEYEVTELVGFTADGRILIEAEYQTQVGGTVWLAIEVGDDLTVGEIAEVGHEDLYSGSHRLSPAGDVLYLSDRYSGPRLVELDLSTDAEDANLADARELTFPTEREWGDAGASPTFSPDGAAILVGAEQEVFACSVDDRRCESVFQVRDESVTCGWITVTVAACEATDIENQILDQVVFTVGEDPEPVAAPFQVLDVALRVEEVRGPVPTLPEEAPETTGSAPAIDSAPATDGAPEDDGGDVSSGDGGPPECVEAFLNDEVIPEMCAEYGYDVG